jgi:hypothetical protein
MACFEYFNDMLPKFHFVLLCSRGLCDLLELF